MTAINIPVQAYDQTHLDLLEKSPRAHSIGNLLRAGLQTTDAAILIHSLFTEQDPHRVGFRSYQELAAKAASRESTFRDYINMTEGSVHAIGAQNTTQKNQTERLGVACAVLAMNQVLGTTEADWERIEESNKRKTLDYWRYVSEGKRIVAVEAKGTVAKQPDLQGSGSCSKMKRDIDAKKKELRTTKQVKAHEEFGVITAIGNAPSTQPRMYLLDPKPQGVDRDPHRARVLARMHYYLRHLTLVSQFRMLLALRNRINALAAHSQIDTFAGVRLTDLNGEQFRLRSVFGDRPLVEVNGIVGRILPPPRQGRAGKDLPTLFIGFAKPIFNLLVAQDFNKLLKWRWAEHVESTHRVRVSLSALNDDHVVEQSGELRLGVNSAGIALGWFR